MSAQGDLSQQESTKFVEAVRGVHILASGILKDGKTPSQRHPSPLPELAEQLAGQLLAYESDFALVPSDYLSGPQQTLAQLQKSLSALRGAGSAPSNDLMTDA